MADIRNFTSPSQINKEGELAAENSSSTETKLSRRYSSDEVADIIRLGLQQDSRDHEGTLDYADLLAVGREVGVDEARIQQAMQLLEEEQRTSETTASLWTRFKLHGVASVIAAVVFFAVDLLTGITTFWSGYVMVILGLFLIVHYVGLRYAPELVQLAMERTQQYSQHRYQAVLSNDDTVTFSITDGLELTETTGLVFFDDDRLVIEHQTADNLLGVLKMQIRETDIPIGEIVSIRLEQKLWNAVLVIQGRSLRSLRNAPGRSSATLRLTINRPSTQAAQQLVATVRSKLNKASKA